MRHYLGRLVLVVGPSGAGKDSIIRGAQARFSGNSRYVFARRTITREADAAAEDHDCVSDMAFAMGVARGDYAVWWRAHGNSYGVPVSIDDDLRVGRTVVFNCSRAIVAEVHRQYPRVAAINIEVAPAILLERIVARGRETRAQAFERVNRVVPQLPRGIEVFSIPNEGSLEDAVGDFCRLLTTLNDAAPDPGRDTLDDQHQHENGDNRGGRLVIVK